ncbi:MAG: hypothetical protein K2K53_11565 [Oscillospiraceae bacterium]|nr:hypothetical protein [Oscillospiraceae bacterium]
MSKKYSIFITVLFCLFTFGFGVALILSPSRDFSEQENRYLSQFKAPTPDSLISGEFMEDFEDYVTDQFPLRDAWIQLKALSERALGKQENNGVYFGTDGQTLFAQFKAPSQEELAKRVGFVNTLGANLDVPVYFSLVPDKSWALSYLLPANAPNVDDGSTIDGAMGLCGENVTFLDLRQALATTCGNTDPMAMGPFYRTDHHWTTMGAQRAYSALMEGMGLTGQAEDLDGLSYQVLSYNEVSDSFYGTTYSSSGAGWVEPDRIHTVIPEGGTKGHVTVTGYPEGKPIESSLYHPEKLEVKDKYAYFLGGNQPLCVIQNPDAQGGKLLVIRDSYSDSLAPFLAEEFQEVHLFDLRYTNMSLKQYVEQNGIDRVLVLYSASNFTTDINLFKMAH